MTRANLRNALVSFLQKVADLALFSGALLTSDYIVGLPRYRTGSNLEPKYFFAENFMAAFKISSSQKFWFSRFSYGSVLSGVRYHHTVYMNYNIII